MLLTIDEIEFKLNEKFSPFNGEMDDLILKRRTTPASTIKFAENKLNVSFPDKFVDFLTRYNIDNFSLGNISFGNGDDYLDKIVRINTDDFNHWWTGKYRPNGVICIAISDHYSILLNANDGRIYAITSEQGMDGWKPIANDFELFVRGVGSLFLKECIPSETNKLVESTDDSFWSNI